MYVGLPQATSNEAALLDEQDPAPNDDVTERRETMGGWHADLGQVLKVDGWHSLKKAERQVFERDRGHSGDEIVQLCSACLRRVAVAGSRAIEVSSIESYRRTDQFFYKSKALDYADDD